MLGEERDAVTYLPLSITWITFSHLQTLGTGSCFHCILELQRLGFAVFRDILVSLFHLSQTGPLHCFLFAHKRQGPAQYTPRSSERLGEPLCAPPSRTFLIGLYNKIPESDIGG